MNRIRHSLEAIWNYLVEAHPLALGGIFLILAGVAIYVIFLVVAPPL